MEKINYKCTVFRLNYVAYKFIFCQVTTKNHSTMSEKFNFKAELNGVAYDTPEKFIEDLKKATTEGSVKSLSYQYSSVSEQEPKNVCGCDANKTKQCDENECTKTKKVYSKDTVERVASIDSIIEDVANLSEDISGSREFGQNRLYNTRDILRSSLEKIKYLISGMQMEDRRDFCEKFLDGMRHLYEVADSECKDLIYEEAKYRQFLSETNDDIEKKINNLQSEIDDLVDDEEDNNIEMEFSANRCAALEDLRDFFGDLVKVLEIK